MRLSWRAVLLFLCLVGTAAATWNEWPQPTYALGAGVAPTAKAGIWRITSAAKSGLRPGDLIDRRQQSWTSIVRLYVGGVWSAAETVPITVSRSGVEHRFVLRPTIEPFTGTWMYWANVLSAVALLLTCFLLAARRSNDVEARLMIAYILLPYILSQISGTVSPWPLLDVFLKAISMIAYLAGFAALIAFAGLFGRPLSRARFAWSLVSVLLVTYLFSSHFGELIAWLAAIPDPYFFIGHENFFWGLSVFAPALCLVWACVSAKPSERSRVVWSTFAVCPLLLFVAFVAWSGAVRLDLALAGYTVGWCVTAIVLAYALLQRRLLDIGFAANRAAVFTVVSVMLVGAFILIEWLLSEWLRDASHSTNLVVSGILVLGLGLSMRFVHTRADRVVDEIFFRRRHENEQALRTFAREVPYITDGGVLLERTQELLKRHTDAAFSRVLLAERDGAFGRLDPNDPLVLRMQATHEIAAVHNVNGTALDADSVYPMVARGRLVGMLALGPRASGEEFAPDESAAIAQIAAAVATALDLLPHRNGEHDILASLVDAVTSLREEIRGVFKSPQA